MKSSKERDVKEHNNGRERNTFKKKISPDFGATVMNRTQRKKRKLPEEGLIKKGNHKRRTVYGKNALEKRLDTQGRTNKKLKPGNIGENNIDKVPGRGNT